MIGTQELIFIAVLAFLLFGAKKIPELMRSLGRAQGEFQHAKQQFEKEVKVAERVEDEKKRKAKELEELQRKAQLLDIDILGKDADALRAEIAAKAQD